MGVAAAIGAAAVWATSATLMASQTARVDSLSISALRLLAASVFFLAILVPMGATGDFTSMSAGDAGQVIATGLMNLAVGDTMYIFAIAAMGIHRAYPISLSLFTVFSFLFAVLFLDEPVGVATGFGAVLVVGGVILVAGRGRAPATSAGRLHATAVAVDTAIEPAPALSKTIAAPLDTAPAVPAIAGAAPVVAAPSTTPAGGGGGGAGEAGAVVVPFLGVVRVGTGLGLGLLVIAAVIWACGTVWLGYVSPGHSATA